MDNVSKPGSVEKIDIHKALEDPEFCIECELDKERQVCYRWMPDATQQKIVMLHSQHVSGPLGHAAAPPLSRSLRATLVIPFYF